MSEITESPSDASITTARERFMAQLRDAGAVDKGFYRSPYPQYQVTRPGMPWWRLAIAHGYTPLLTLLIVAAGVFACVNELVGGAVFIGTIAVSIAVSITTHKWRWATYFLPQYEYTSTVASAYDAIEARTRKHAAADSRVAGIAADITAVRAGLFELLDDLETLIDRTQRSQMWHAAETLGPDGSDVRRRDALAAQVVDVVAAVTAASWAAGQIASSTAGREPVKQEPVKPFVSSTTTQNQEQMRQALERLSTVHS